MFVAEDGKHGYLANAFTQPDYRGRGIQRDLLLARLHDGAELGLDLLVTDVESGTTSLRNCWRVGFEIESVDLIWTAVPAGLHA
jgi:ribosomal protein S18 acetylase RimI-like enzyme